MRTMNSFVIILLSTWAGAALFSGLVLLVVLCCWRYKDRSQVDGEPKFVLPEDTQQLIDRNSFLTEQVQPELTAQGQEKAPSYTDLSLSSTYSKEGQGGEEKSELPFMPLSPLSTKLSATGENGSQMSLDKETGSPLGQIQINIRFVMPKKILKVKILDATNLPRKGPIATSNPYVTVCLIPGKTKVKTTIKTNDVNPMWNEKFTFKGISYEKLLSRSMHLQVYDHNNYGDDGHIGEVRLPLSQVGISKLAQGVGLWKNLHRFLTDKSNCGELLVSLRYQRTTEKIQLFLIKGKDFQGYQGSLPDVYIKVLLTYRGKNIEEKKSQENKKSPNPVFNETFMFSVPRLKLEDTAIKLTIKDNCQKGKKKLIGKVELGAYSGNIGVQHWNAMCTKPNLPIAQWHELIKPVEEKNLLLET